MGSPPASALPLPPEDRIAAASALSRVLSSAVFQRSPRSRDFLAYVVTETLAGRGERLSERTVGRRALHHGPDFDGRLDASVRVRASRVRAALEDYYAGEGANDRLRIALPPGRYVPEFVPRDVMPEPEQASPGLAVIGFRSSGDERASLLAASLGDSLTNQLARSVDVRVVGPTSLQDDVMTTGRALRVSCGLEGRVTLQDGKARLAARLSASDTGDVLWSIDDSVSEADLAGLDVEGTWARAIAAQLTDAMGVVVRHELMQPRLAPTSTELAARLAFYSYLRNATAESVAEAATLLDRALAEGRRTAPLLAMRAAIANAALSYDAAADRRVELDRAESLAREALARDGSNAHALLVLAFAARERRQWDLAIGTAEKAVAVAPCQPSYLVGAGITICASGGWDRGASLIEEGMRLNPGMPAHNRTWLAMRHLVAGDDAAALAEACVLPTEGYVWGPLYRAMALSGLGYLDQARAEAAVVQRSRPDIWADPESFFIRRMNVTDEQLRHLVESLERLRQT